MPRWLGLLLLSDFSGAIYHHQSLTCRDTIVVEALARSSGIPMPISHLVDFRRRLHVAAAAVVVNAVAAAPIADRAGDYQCPNSDVPR